MAEITVVSRKYGEKKILVDDCDLSIISQYKWGVTKIHGIFYAREVGGNYLHRLILGNPVGFVDHANGDGLDNRRQNIRQSTPGQNSANKGRVPAKTSSKYKGVFPDLLPGRSGWYAMICSNHKRIYIGHFSNEEDAARAYDKEALKYHGKFARLNFPGNAL